MCRHLLNSHALYFLYRTLTIHYMNYCCEFLGNTYKRRIQLVYMLQKKLYESVNTRVSTKVSYLSHTGPNFHFFNTLGIYDYDKFPRHLLRFFERLYGSHNHTTRNEVNNSKIIHSRRSQNTSV